MNYAAETMTKDERSILLYAESCAVDGSGLMEAVRMNAADFENLRAMQNAGLVLSGRVPFHSKAFERGRSHWVTLTEDGWALASACRRLRAKQISPWRREVDEILAEKEGAAS